MGRSIRAKQRLKRVRRGIKPKQKNASDRLNVGLLHNNLETCLVAIQNGADVNTLCNGQTMLHRAVVNNNIGLIRTLIKLGANIGILNSNGLTPMHLSCTPDNKKTSGMIVRALLNIVEPPSHPDQEEVL